MDTPWTWFYVRADSGPFAGPDPLAGGAVPPTHGPGNRIAS